MVAVGPAGEGLYILEDIVDVPGAVAGSNVADCSHIGERVQPLDGREVVIVGQRGIARTTLWVDDDCVVEIRGGVESMVKSGGLRNACVQLHV